MNELPEEEYTKPFFKRYPWLIRPTALLLLILSPITMPIMVCLNNMDDVKSYYNECFFGLRGRK